VQKRKKETTPEKKKGMEVCHNEPAPTSAPWRMNDKWLGNSFLLGSGSFSEPWWLAVLLFI
jgi:hypothetical protein